MSGFGTDVLALACIACGAAVGGGVMLAADGDGEGDARCAVEAVAASPRVVVSVGGDDPVVVTAPRASVHRSGDCAVVVDETVRLRLDEARAEMERARERVERARERIERSRERVERVRVELRGLEDVELGAGLEAELEAEIEARLEAEMARLEEKLRELDRINR